MKIVLLVGAGFSRWSCGLPLVSELFDFNIHADNSSEEKRLERLRQEFERWRKAHPSEHVETFIRHAQTSTTGFNLVNWYVTRRLTEAFIVNSGRRHTWYINSSRARKHAGILRARRIIEKLRSRASDDGFGIVTTNYDLIAEYALGSRQFHYGIENEKVGYTPYPYIKALHLTGSIPILKLHGSISWSLNAKHPDSRHGLTGKCLIVPPVREKQAPPPLRAQWQFARKILASCEKLVVFGFSFNEYDEAIRKLISTSASSDVEIILIDPTDFRDRIRPLFPKQKISHLNPMERGLIGALDKELRAPSIKRAKKVDRRPSGIQTENNKF